MGGSTRTFGLRTFHVVRHIEDRGRAGWATGAVSLTAVSAVVAGLLVAVPGAGAAATTATPFAVSLVSVLPDGSGAFATTQPGVTASTDGRYVAFVGTGGGFTGQLFVRDRQANTTTLVSKDAGGAAAAHPIDAAAMTANGNAVAFLTTASLLASVPDDGTEHVYVADWPSGAVRSIAVPQPPAGQAVAVGTAGVSLSADGGEVAFVRSNPADSSQAVVLVNTASGSPTVLPAQDGDATYAFPQLSDDGNVVGYEAIDVNDTHGLRISSSAGAVLDQLGDILAQDDDVVAPFALSGDGKNIAYSTYVMDRQSVVVERIDGSTAPKLVGGGGGLNAPRLAPDGHAVSFASGYLGLQLFVATPPDSEGGTLQVSMASDGSDADGSSTPGTLTQDGQAVAFSSTATNLGGPTVGSEQVYYATSNDTTPPSWPSGAALSVDATGYFTVDLSWPDAADDVGVAEYQLTIDGSRTVLLDGVQTAYTVTGLPPNTAHSFAIKAVDTAGRATGSLTASATTKAVTRTEVIDTVSVLPDGGAADSSGINPSVSAAGRYVAFTASRSCLASNGNGVLASGPSTCYGQDQAFVRDREAGTTQLLSHLPGSTAPGSGYASDVAISGDGSEVAFVSDSDGLVAGDTNGTADLFVADRATGAVHAVAVPALGAPFGQIDEGNGVSMDADGTHVAFVAQDTSGNDHLVVEDWRAGTGAVVPLPSTIWEVDEPELSADGSRIAFVANADDSSPHVMVVDVANPGAPVLDRLTGYARYYGYDGTTYGPRIALSADGRYLAYPNPADAQFRNMYVQDLSSLSTAPVVLTSPSQPNCNPSVDACYDSGAPALSADGSTIVFDPMNSSGNHTLYRASPITAAPAPIALLPDGSTDNQYPGDRTPAVTADGTGTVFQSNNDGLAALATGSDIVYAHGPDPVAPSFPAGAALTTDNQTSTQVRLNWPAATDDHVVIGYRVTKDGVTIADLDPTATSFTVTGLTAGQTYHFAVSGVDAALNAGTPLTLAFNSSGGSQQPGQAALAVDASAGGGHATLAWDASTTAGVTGYRVLRGVGDTGPLAPIADVTGVSTTSYVDSGLTASTTYRYEVHTLGSDGEQNYTVTTSVTTPALANATIAVNTLSVDGARAAQLGSDLTVTVHGGPNLTGTATIGYDNADATTGTAQVSLTQTAADSGVYTGKFTLAEGIATVTSVSASLSDGAGHASTADATGLPITVSGALKVTVDSPSSGSVDGAKLAVLSDASGTGGQTTVSGGQTVTVPLAPASDYALTLTEPASYQAAPDYAVAEQQNISISAGTTSTVEVNPVLPAFLSVNVSPQASAQVDVYDASGALIGTKTGVDAAAGNAFGPVPAGSQVTIDTTELDESLQVSKHQSTMVTLAPGSNPVSIAQTPLPTATITGKVTINGVAANYGHVTATETVDGRPWTFTANTKSDGSYSLSVLAGDVTISATASDSLPGSKTVTVAAGATGTGDLDLVGPHHYQITLGLTTVEPDGSTATLPVDWRTAVHFGVFVNGPRISSSGWWGGLTSTIVVDGVPGDVYTMCANGAQAGLPAACSSITLGDVDAATLDVTLVGAGRITGTLLGSNGQAFGGHWTAYTYEIVNGQRRAIDDALGAGSALSIDLPKAGMYEIDVTADGGLRAQPITASVASGAIVDLGSIPLGLDNNFGGSGNSVVAQSSEITPGQAAEFRASYHYYGGSTVPATIRLGIPAGTTLVPGSVTVNGQGVADPSVVNGFAEVALPDLAPGATGTVHYAVETTSATPAGPLTSIVRMKYGTSGDGLIGSATTTVVGVTLAAPSQIRGLTAVVTGHAPAGATVNVYDEFGQQVGSAFAGEGGLWSATVTLASRGEGHSYALQAATTIGGVTVRSNTEWVTHNSHNVMPTSLSVGQPDGRVVSFDPNSGVARFPYVFVPGMGISVSACFAAGTQVSNMSARIGPQLGGASGVGVLYGSASSALVSNAMPRSNAALIQANGAPSSVNSAALVGGSGGGNCYSAQLNPSVSQLGAIYLDYAASPAPFSASDFEMSTGAANENLPPALATHTGDQSTDNADGSHTLTTTLPSLGGATLSTTSRVTAAAYTPTAADLADAAGAGVPVYGFSTSLSEGSDSLTAQLHAYVPQSWLQTASQSSASSALVQPSRTSALALQPAGLAGDLFEVTLDVTIKVGEKGETLESIKDALTAGGPYQELSKLIDEIDNSECADAFTKQNLADYLQNVAKDIRNIQIASSVASIAGVFVGALLGPLGSLALGAALDYFGDRAEQKTLDSAAKFVKDSLGQCIKDQSDEIADPDWIIDPSGFTYEAVTSNRLPGVTATLLQASSPDGPFKVWDAAAYGQENPLTTDSEGKYGWNVPFGYWKVAYTKPGYETAYSQVFQIPPPRFDVNVGLVRLAAPTVTLTRATSGMASGVTIGFDDYLKVDSVTSRVSVVDGSGNAVAGSVQAVDAQAAPDGTNLAKTFRFVPDQPFTDGEALTLTVAALVRDYADHTLDSAYTAALTASAPTTPGLATDVRAFAIDAHTLRVEWTAPGDDGGSPLTGFHVTTSSGQPVDVAADATSATISGLSPMTSYTVAVAAVNAVGAGAAQSALVTTPPLAPDEAFGSFQVPPTIDGGTTAQATVTLPGPASADTTVTLSSDSSTASVPHSVTVPAGQSSATFTVTTSDPVLDTDVTITASRGGVSLDAPLTVRHVDVPLQATASDGSVALSWTAASEPDVTGYRVMRATGPDGDFTAVADVSGIGTTTYTDSGLAGGTTYSYQVRALYAGSASSPWSAVASATTPVVMTQVSLSASVSPSAPTYGQDLTVAVTMTPAVAGATVQVSEGTTVLASGTIGADGTARIVVSGLHAGDHQLTLSYAGSATTTPASTILNVSVLKAATMLTVDTIRSLPGLLALVLGRYRVTAHLVRSDGAPVAGAQVVIDSWKGPFCVATTDASGVATCAVPPRLRSVVLLGQVHASYAGSADYLPASFGSADPPGHRAGGR